MPCLAIETSKMNYLNFISNIFKLWLFILFISQASNSWADCDGTVEEIKKCATDGRALSQHMLGEMYFYGNEVPRNYKEAFKWHMLAARQGYKSAQSKLGFSFYNGWGIEKSKVKAYVWWSLGSIGQNQPIDQLNLETLEKELSQAEIERAQDIAKKCLESKFKNCQ